MLHDGKGKGRLITLTSAAKVKILAHVKIRKEVNPYDPEWELYLEDRLGWKLRQTAGGSSRVKELWEIQKGRCARCGGKLCLGDEDWNIHHRIWRSLGGGDTLDNLGLLHANCHRQLHARNEKPVNQPAFREGRL